MKTLYENGLLFFMHILPDSHSEMNRKSDYHGKQFGACANGNIIVTVCTIISSKLTFLVVPSIRMSDH